MRGSVRSATAAVRLPLGSVAVLGAAVAWLSLVASLVVWTVAPAAAGWRPYVVMTDSMRPSVAAGDIVLISDDTAADERPLVPGDVALVADPARTDGTRLHRFLRLDDDGRVVTKGDANAQEDQPSAATQVLGRTRIVVPAIGLPSVWLRQGDVPSLVVAGAGTWLALLVVLLQRSGDASVRRPARRRGPAAPRHARPPRVPAHGPVRRAPVAATAAALAVVLTVVQPAAPGQARFVSSVANGPSGFAAGAWMGYTWTVTNDRAPASWWRLKDNVNNGTVAAAAVGTITGTYARSSRSTFLAGTGVNVAVPPAAPSYDGAQHMQAGDTRQDIAFGDVYDFDGRKPFSVEVWFRQTQTCTACYQRVVSKEYFVGPTDRSGWSIVIFPQDGSEVAGWVGVTRVLDATYDWSPSLVPVTLNAWTHVVGTYDGTTLSLYLNGRLATSGPSAASLRDIPHPLRVGDLDVGTIEHFVGDVDELSVYTSALTARQVTARYLAGRP